jgi:TetR/AcrR family transcriptional repressor of nem operon
VVARKPSSTPPSARTRARRREILEAAEQVFGEGGYSDATTAQIAKKVGISQPALYRYFPSKRDLFLEALALRQKEIEAGVRDALSAPGSARDKIRAIARSTASLALAHPHMAKLRMQAVAAAAQDEEVRRGVRNSLDRMLAGHEALVDQAKAEGSFDPSVDTHAAAASIAGQAFLLYVAITADHPLANEEDAGAAIEGFVGLLSSRPD